MNSTQKVYSSSDIIRASVAAFCICLCLLAMFSGPMMSAHGPSHLSVTDPSLITIILIGLAIGCYGTIVGIGGGPLIIPTLILFYGWENEHLVATSLLIVFLNATSGTIGYARQKRIDYKAGLKFAAAALPGAVLSGFIHHTFDIKMFDVIFGVFLLLLAVYTLLSLPKVNDEPKEITEAQKASYRHVTFIDRFGKTFNFYSDDKLGIIMNLILGFFVGFLGIGGGVFQVPILIFLLNYPAHIATATSHYITMLACFFALLPHIYLGNIYFAEAIWMGLGVIIGAQVGVWLAPKIKSKVIIYLFIVVIILFAAKLIL